MTLRNLPGLIVQLCLLSCLLSGCGAGNGDGLDENEDKTNIDPTLTSIQETIFTPICAQCHVGSGAPRGLRLDSLDRSMSSLLDVIADEDNNVFRVLIGDAENSYLIQKLEGTASFGSRMPLGQPALSQDTIDVIKEWINDGTPVE